MKTFLNKHHPKKSERGQAIVLIVFAFIGLVAMVGLVTDTGLLMIGYGKLKRSVDAAAVAAAQEFRPDPDTGVLNTAAMENAARGMLQINQIGNVDNITVHTCEDTGADRPTLCNPDPDGNPLENRKLVEVTATTEVPFGFLRVIGINGATINVTSIGEAATLDLVLLIDTSGSMAYETTDPDGDSDNQATPDPGDDPRVCNTNDNCQPMRAVKDVAMDFVDSLIYFDYDRVSVIAMTGQAANSSAIATRDPVEVIPLEFDRNTIFFSIDTLKVFQPRQCAGFNGMDDFNTGECLRVLNGTTYEKPICPLWENLIGSAPQDVLPASCPSSNIGGMLALAQEAFTGSNGLTTPRLDSSWVTVMIASGPANGSTSEDPDFEFGFCPQNTWYIAHPDYAGTRWCRDKIPGNERSPSAPTISFQVPYPPGVIVDEVQLYDAEDYARDMGDNLAAAKSGNGVTIYTIGLGQGVSNMPAGWTAAVPCSMAEQRPTKPACGEAEYLLTYIAREAGDALNPEINHGEYFYSPNTLQLKNIFEVIAQNIATKISQ